MRSVSVVLPLSMCAEMPMLRSLKSGCGRNRSAQQTRQRSATMARDEPLSTRSKRTLSSSATTGAAAAACDDRRREAGSQSGAASQASRAARGAGRASGAARRAAARIALCNDAMGPDGLASAKARGGAHLTPRERLMTWRCTSSARLRPL